MKLLETDEFTVLSFRCRKNTKENVNRLLKWFKERGVNITQDEFLKLSMDLNLEQIKRGARLNKNHLPFLDRIEVILSNRKG